MIYYAICMRKIKIDCGLRSSFSIIFKILKKYNKKLYIYIIPVDLGKKVIDEKSYKIKNSK